MATVAAAVAGPTAVLTAVNAAKGVADIAKVLFELLIKFPDTVKGFKAAKVKATWDETRRKEFEGYLQTLLDTLQKTAEVRPFPTPAAQTFHRRLTQLHKNLKISIETLKASLGVPKPPGSKVRVNLTAFGRHSFGSTLEMHLDAADEAVKNFISHFESAGSIDKALATWNTQYVAKLHVKLPPGYQRNTGAFAEVCALIALLQSLVHDTRKKFSSYSPTEKPFRVY